MYSWREVTDTTLARETLKHVGPGSDASDAGPAHGDRERR